MCGTFVAGCSQTITLINRFRKDVTVLLFIKPLLIVGFGENILDQLLLLIVRA